MDSVRWNKIEFLFEEALKLDPSERENFIFKESGDDKEIFDEVISLLREDSNIHTIFKDTKIELLPEGETIGPHLLRCEGFAGLTAQHHPPRLAPGAISSRE